uniref:Uncharacterized protein n=1 Tax=Kalanchoe fedtschenkoi TaxID=63787 RepID=A0A7N0TA42_KALFE
MRIHNMISESLDGPAGDQDLDDLEDGGSTLHHHLLLSPENPTNLGILTTTTDNMISGLATASSSSFALSSPLVRFSKPNSGLRGVPAKLAFAPIRASGGGNDGRVSRVRIVEKLRKAAGVVVLTAVTTAMIGKFGQFNE